MGEVLKLFKAFLHPLKSSILAVCQASPLVDRQRRCSKEVFPRIADVTVQPQLVEIHLKYYSISGLLGMSYSRMYE